MSVLLSWHEKVRMSSYTIQSSLARTSCPLLTVMMLISLRLQLVEIAGAGSIVRVMSDRRTV